MVNRLRRPAAWAVVLIFLLAGHCEGRSLRDVFHKASPSVVVIKTMSVLDRSSLDNRYDFVEQGGIGSGVLISADGRVLTAAHVVQVADRIAVEFRDGQLIAAKVVTSAPWADVALLQLEKQPALNRPARLGDSDAVDVGDEVFVVGAPYGLSHTLTAGYVSGRHVAENTTIGHFSSVELFQTDAAINTGNSGGPLFNMDGEVIGVVSHILSKSGGFEGIGFAVTSNMVKTIISKGRFWSGMEGVLVTGVLAEVLNVPQPAGFLIQRVAEGSPASRMGIKPSSLPIVIDDREILAGGDIVLEFAGITVQEGPESFEQFRSLCCRLRPGDTIAVKVLRAGKILTLSTRLE